MNSFHVLLDLLPQVLKCFWSFLWFLESCLNRLTQSLKQNTTGIKTHGASLWDPQGLTGFISFPKLLRTLTLTLSLPHPCSYRSVGDLLLSHLESKAVSYLRQLLIGTKFSSFSKFLQEYKNPLPSVLPVYQCRFVWAGLHHLHKAKFLYLPASVWSYCDPAAMDTKQAGDIIY